MMLKQESGYSKETAGYAAEAALLLGFQSESAVFPVIGEDGDIDVPKTGEELLALWKTAAKEAPEDFEAALDNAGEVFETDFRTQRGLEDIFQKGIFLKDENHDMLPDRLDVKIILPENAGNDMVTAACNLAFRFGMETTELHGPIIADDGYEGNAVILQYAEHTELTMETCGEAVHVYLRGAGEALEAFSSQLCMRFPKTDAFRSWSDVLMELTDDFVMRGADGQLAYMVKCQKEQPGDYTVYGSPELSRTQREAFPRTVFYNYKSGREVYGKVYELPWEAELFEEILKEKIYPKLTTGSQVRIAGALSEDRDVRQRLAEKIRGEIEKKGAVLEENELICAYKQGFSWMDESVIPKIQAFAPDRVEIYFKPFLPEGQTEWLDENGATPSYHNLKADDPEKWYDLPIRYLQELYPIEDVLTEKLGIERGQVAFFPYEGEKNLTYLCKAYRGDEVCFEASYQAECSERPYLDEFPQMGKVHPSTGYIRVWIDGEEVIYEKIRTDLEAVWDIYQAEVLPDCREYIEQKTGGDIRTDRQPFFHELRLDVTVSEPDYRVGCREDLISSLDALHEDMYFTGSDYFKNYGVQKADVMLDAPGLILPVIHNREGRPLFKVTLSEQLKEKPCILCGGVEVCTLRDREEVSLKISRIEPENGQFAITIETSGVEDGVLRAYTELLERGLAGSRLSFGGAGRLRFQNEAGEIFEAVLKESDETEASDSRKEKEISDIDLHEHELIGYDTYLEIINELKHVPGIEVFRTAVSYTGREIYAIQLVPEYEGYLSMTKRLTKYPGEIINARHHANEVSSTNAAFILLKKLLTEDIYREVPGKLNLVIVPMENVDGAAIHYELQKEHPYWKFHVARFNSLGKEFYHEHFQKDTIHTEAMGLTRLFEKYVPDMIVDNHGVPSHEWEQQFSGYTSPSYKGFWLPRSLLYGYFWYVTNPEYKDNYPVNKKMEDVIADKIAEDEEMAAWNKEWSEQFEKYAHAWMPKLFPANYYKDMINYWIPFPADKAHRYPSIRFPWITTVAYTSEVADETAQGEYLNLCARAHVAHDEATIQMLMRAEHVFDCRCECRDGQIFAGYTRKRPMIVW